MAERRHAVRKPTGDCANWRTQLQAKGHDSNDKTHQTLLEMATSDMHDDTTQTSFNAVKHSIPVSVTRSARVRKTESCSSGLDTYREDISVNRSLTKGQNHSSKSSGWSDDDRNNSRSTRNFNCSNEDQSKQYKCAAFTALHTEIVRPKDNNFMCKRGHELSKSQHDLCDVDQVAQRHRNTDAFQNNRQAELHSMHRSDDAEIRFSTNASTKINAFKTVRKQMKQPNNRERDFFTEEDLDIQTSKDEANWHGSNCSKRVRIYKRKETDNLKECMNDISHNKKETDCKNDSRNRKSYFTRENEMKCVSKRGSSKNDDSEDPDEIESGAYISTSAYVYHRTEGLVGHDEEDFRFGSNFQQNAATQHSSFLMDFNFLSNLIEKNKDASYVLLEITKSQEALRDCVLLAANDSKLLEILLSVLAKAYSCNTHPHALIDLFLAITEVKLFDSITLFLVDYQTKLDALTDDEVKSLIATLKNIFQIVWQHMIRNPSSIFTLTRIYTATNQLFDGIVKLDTVSIGTEIYELLQRITSQKLKLEKQHKSGAGSTRTQNPPDNFRGISIYPTVKEIKETIQPFLRSNKVNGAYDDLEHYLDVQFRLLREDCIAPLREGITEYMKSVQAAVKDTGGDKQNTKRQLDLHIYRNVYYLLPVVNEHGLCYKMQFEMTQRLQKTNWSVSKRLQFGSLVCLSEDEFDTIYIATIVDRENIKDGIVTIHLETPDTQVTDIMNKAFKMAETSACFAPYKHILSALQNIHDGDICFTKYIVECDNVINPPAYLTPDSVYDLRPLVDEEFVIHPNNRMTENLRTIPGDVNENFSERSNPAKNVRVLEPSTWPRNDLFHLEDSQFTAVQRALTKEFAIIQGPPGTGKTYIGLKIAKALLYNRNSWLGNPESVADIRPMLIVCYRNHALDQFLLGIIKFFKGDVLRVGNRSRNPELDRYSLKNYRSRNFGTRNILENLRKDRKEALDTMEAYSEDLKEISIQMELYKTEIVHESVLKPHMESAIYTSLLNDYHRNKSNGDSLIVVWLGILKIMEDCKTKSKETAKGNDKNETNAADMKDRQAEVIVDDDDTEELIAKRRTKEEAIWKETRLNAIAFFVNDDPNIRESGNNTQTSKQEKRYRLYLKHALTQRLTSVDIMSDEEASTIINVWHLDDNSKWRLYRLWIKRLCESKLADINQRKTNFEIASERCREIRMQINKEIMKQSSVIGMTTSSAAQYQSILRDIGARIIIVEEAAEVLESHIVVALSKYCEHLILIGDHKQLRPNHTVYKLAVKYKLNISLFERMILNNVSYNCLRLQHRMRPEIADIVRHIYPELEDHEDVKLYDNVKGVSTNLCFINHGHLEEFGVEMKSYSNAFEGNYVISFSRYLLQQGYDRTKITVLCAYNGQLLHIRKLMSKEKLEGVRVAVVDDYQGEENDIVILSLVRSNEIGKIGFLKTENRICVALSRARIGFFLLGNFDHLAKHSRLWEKIKCDMTSMGFVHNGLTLYSRNHPDAKPICAKVASDFDQAPEGCCSMMCDIRLPCGHACDMFCHVLDVEHEKYQCQKRCTKLCEAKQHPCKRRCYEICPPCDVLVFKTLEDCGHQQDVACSAQPLRSLCKHPCENVLPCGHTCTCGEYHTKKCQVFSEDTLPCGHTATGLCYIIKSKEYHCKERCTKLLCDAKHQCPDLCYEKCKPCKTLVVKILNGCGHTQPVPCSDPPLRSYCKLPCKDVLPCGHVCSNACRSEHTTMCMASVKITLSCGHTASGKCYIINSMQYLCKHRCTKLLCDAKHQCPDLCYEKCKPCKTLVAKVLDGCGHTQPVPCSDPPSRSYCKLPCKDVLPCGHVCSNACGSEHTTMCMASAKVTLSCGHTASGKCHIINSMQYLCKYRCTKLLCDAKHQCPNLCYEKCKLCKTLVSKSIEGCGHMEQVECAKPPLRFYCKYPCKDILPCGHVCTNICGKDHISICMTVDQITLSCGHIAKGACSIIHSEQYQCKKRCKKLICDAKHKCHGRCYEKCQPCKTLVFKQLDDCGHTQKVPCAYPPSRTLCKRPCEDVLSCGHVCGNKCGDEHAKICTYIGQITLTCGHIATGVCHFLNSNKYQCKERCKNIVCDANHQCPDYCYEKCKPCRQPVLKQLNGCGHTQQVPCSEQPTRSYCFLPCEDILSCGHVCANTCREEHTKTCMISVSVTLSCEHIATGICWKKEDTLCLMPCKAVLSCGHICRGKCDDCYNNRIHKQCRSGCDRVLICEHECMESCNSCNLCKWPCANRCTHSKCVRLCGEPCALCQEKCLWQCPHFACTRKCSEPCNRPPCYKPCPKLLKCKHKCIGFCGEPCPPLCRVCHRDIVTEIVFGDENDIWSRFVFLDDCGHLIEARALDRYMNMYKENGVIQLPVCPLCKIPIRKNCRYGAYVNAALHDIERVKRAVIANGDRINKLRAELDKGLLATFLLPFRFTTTRNRSELLSPMCNNNNTDIAETGSKLAETYEWYKKVLTEQQLITMTNQYVFLKKFNDLKSKLFMDPYFTLSHYSRHETLVRAYVDDIVRHVERPRDMLTHQEFEDYRLEYNRLNMFLSIAKLKRVITKAGQLGKVTVVMQVLQESILTDFRFTDKRQANCKAVIDELTKQTNIQTPRVTDDESLQIRQAAGFTKGHWLKCPNDHVYAIENCEGSSERYECPECKTETQELHQTPVCGSNRSRKLMGRRVVRNQKREHNYQHKYNRPIKEEH